MIKTGNAEIDAVITALVAQRDSALDNLAIMSGKMAVYEATTKALQEQLEQVNVEVT